jgi:hypothetical protein
MSQQTTNRYFDELASGLASGSISRGRALRLMGAALLGGTLASFPGGAWAAKGGRSSCAKFCQSLFGANTPEEGECVSQGTKGQGPCFTCTTETGCGPNFTKPTCPAGQTYSCSTCKCCTSNGGTCTSGSDCCSGSCESNLCLPPSGTTLVLCTCNDNATPVRCSAFEPCLGSAAERELVCSALCAEHGGVFAISAQCNHPICV